LDCSLPAFFCVAPLQTAYEPCSSNEFSGSCCSRLGAPVGLGGKHANEEASLRSKPLSEPCSSNEFSGSCCSRLGAPVGLGGKHGNEELSFRSKPLSEVYGWALMMRSSPG